MSRKKKKKALDPGEDFANPAKQERLAGMTDAAIEEIEDQAARVKVIEQRRMTLLRQEMDARELLGEIMAKHGRARYRYHGWEVTTTETKPKVKVKRYEEEEAGSALSDDTNPGGADSPGESPAPAGDQEQHEVAGASTEANQEAGAAGTQAGGEDDTPF